MEIYIYIYILGFQLKFVLGLGLNSLSLQLDGTMQLGGERERTYLPFGTDW